jgi:hypothetical protein
MTGMLKFGATAEAFEEASPVRVPPCPSSGSFACATTGSAGGTGAVAIEPLAVAVVLSLEICCARSGVLAGRLAVLAESVFDPAVVVRLYPLERSEELARAACDEMPDEAVAGTGASA